MNINNNNINNNHHQNHQNHPNGAVIIHTIPKIHQLANICDAIHCLRLVWAEIRRLIKGLLITYVSICPSTDWRVQRLEIETRE